MYLRPDDPKSKGAGTVTWAEYLQAFAGYTNRYGNSQSAEGMVKRGGFEYWELVGYLGHEPTTWTPAR